MTLAIFMLVLARNIFFPALWLKHIFMSMSMGVSVNGLSGGLLAIFYFYAW